jgi:release factor glutamine methyltransferase
MTLETFKTYFQEEIAALYAPQESHRLLQILCEDLLQWSKSQYFIKSGDLLTTQEETTLIQALKGLKSSKPVQYITGLAHFYGHIFNVTKDTLIPRQETEELVHLIIQEHKNAVLPRILDIGSGSGCIAISLALGLPCSKVDALDFAVKALQVAQENAKILNATVRFIKQDILKTSTIDAYDIVVSNPPYVRELEKVAIHSNVLDHEPHTALFVENDDALVFYNKVLTLTKPHVNTLVYFEINQYLGSEVLSLAQLLGYTAAIHKDLNGNDRMMKCWQD